MSDDSSGSTASADGEEVDPLVGSVIADRYRVAERLGVGGMGAVYRAEHVLMQKPVAVKVLHREMTVMGEVVKRFEREAIAAGRIDHPNVTVATDFGKLEDGSFYLVLEYVPGRSLSLALAEDGAFPAERALFIARQVAGALGAAHAAGIVHRDLKPDNIMLIERGGTKDFVKVLDFGIAKVNTEGVGASQLTRLGSVFGTPAYMSPEQAAGQPVDGRADLYSLGLVLYEMLAGKPAFASDELVALLTKQLTEPPPPLPSSVDEGATELVRKLVEKDPNDRPQSAEALISAIDARLGPMALPPDSTSLGAPSARGQPSVAHAMTAPSGSGAFLGPLSGPTSARLRAALKARSVALATRVLRGETVRVVGRDVPLWLLVAAACAVLVGTVLVLVVPGGKAPSIGGTTVREVRAPEPEIGPFLLRAKEGDQEALKFLEARPEKGRTAGEWAAIAKGRGKLSEHAAALAAVQRAVEADASLAADPEVLGVVRRAADDEGSRRAAFDLCVGLLGAGGADVLFDVWAATSQKTEATTSAKAALDREDVREQASKALRIALDLRRASRCDDVKRLVDEAREYADERAFRPLNQFSSRGGCGFLGLADCYPCLRQGTALTDALEATQLRKGPRF